MFQNNGRKQVNCTRNLVNVGRIIDNLHIVNKTYKLKTNKKLLFHNNKCTVLPTNTVTFISLYQIENLQIYIFSKQITLQSSTQP